MGKEGSRSRMKHGVSELRLDLILVKEKEKEDIGGRGGGAKLKGRRRGGVGI